MQPGVSAEDNLYADLGIDPSDHGVVMFEATSFLLSKRKADPTLSMIIWQIGIMGEFTLTKYEPGQGAMKVFKNILLEAFPPEHKLCMYEAASLPGQQPRIEWFALKDIESIPTKSYSTLFVPAIDFPFLAEDRFAELGISESDLDKFYVSPTSELEPV